MGIAGYGLKEYLPALLREQWPAGASWLSLEGTLVFADISGFTKLSERLARIGKAGSEELVGAISSVFTPLIDELHDEGGDVLKFGGDALLFLVSGPDHAARAVRAAVAMRATLRRVGVVETGQGTVRLRMSVGIHSGTIEFMLVGRDHEELVLVGPAASRTVDMEGVAEAGEILVSPDTAALLPRGCLGRPKGEGRLIVRRPAASSATPAITTPTATPGDDRRDLDRYVPLALRGRIESVVAESEHRQVTVAFLHFGAVDRLLVEVGPEETHRRIDELASTIVEICDQLAITIICTDIASDGAKFMLACGAPDAVDEPEARMLRACRGILDRDHGLPVRIGVNRGAVFAGAVGSPQRFTYSTMGDAVNLAARIMGKADPGQLLASEAVIDRCEGRFDLSPLAPFMVKGKSQPVRAFRVGRVRHQQGVLRPGTATFVGRREELAEIAAVLERGVSGRGGAVDVVGEAGRGKSQFVAHATSAWPGRRIDVVGEQYESASPYFGAQQLLRAALAIPDDATPDAAGEALRGQVADRAPDLLPWLPLVGMAMQAEVAPTPAVDALDPRFRRGRLAALAIELLDAVVDEPLLVLVEDSSWLDDASVEVLAAVQRAAVDRPWVVLATTRPDDGGLRAAGATTTTLELQPLGREDVAEIHRSATGRWPAPQVLDELVARSGGNALFVVELARAIARDGLDALPPSVEGVVAARLDRLDVEDRRCLRYLSVAGAHVSVPLVQRAFGDVQPSINDPLQWRRLSDFLEEEGSDSYAFRHDLFRRVAYEALPYARRRDLHRRIALAVLEEHGEHEDVLPLLSLHFSEAQDAEATWRYSIAAGHRATALFAPVEAARFFARALAVARRLDVGGREVSEVARLLGDAHRLAAQYPEAVHAYRMARKAAEDHHGAVEVMLEEGVLRERMGRYREAVRWYLRALRTVAAEPEEPTQRLRAQLAVELAATRHRQGRLEECIEACLDAVPPAQRSGDRRTLAHAYYLLDAAYTDLGRAESKEYRELALPIYQEVGDLVGEADVLNNLGIDAYYEGDMNAALDYYERCRTARTRAGDVMGAAVATNNIGEVYSDQGRFDDAERLFLQALQVFDAVSYPIGLALVRGNLGTLAARRGRHDEARALLLRAKADFAAIGAAPYVAEMDSRLADVPVVDIDVNAATLDVPLDVRPAVPLAAR